MEEEEDAAVQEDSEDKENQTGDQDAAQEDAAQEDDAHEDDAHEDDAHEGDDENDEGDEDSDLTQTQQSSKRPRENEEPNNQFTQSIVLEGGKRMRVTVDENGNQRVESFHDESAAREEEEQQRTALREHVTLEHVKEEYYRWANSLIEMTRYARTKLRAKRAEVNGSLFKYHQQCKTKKSYVEEKLAFTSTSGWIATTPIQYRTRYLPCIANDVDANIITSLVECVAIQGKFKSVKLCAKLNYGSFVRLPSEEELTQHICVAWRLAHECFPIQAKSHPGISDAVYVCTSTPKLKYTNDSKRDKIPMLRTTVQLVWPCISVHDIHHLKTFWMTLDIRLGSQNAFFANIVDQSILKKQHITLRALHAQKVISCRRCVESTKALVDYESSCDEHVEETNLQKNITLCHYCLAGKVVLPIVCKPFAYVHVSETALVANLSSCWENPIVDTKSFAEKSTLEQLLTMSIVADNDEDGQSPLVPELEDFQRPLDAPDWEEQLCANVASSQFGCKNHELGILYTQEMQPIRQLSTRVSNTRITPQTHPDIFQICNKVIHTIGDGFYNYLIGADITINHTKNMIFINVQGKNQRYCLLNGANHPQNRIYFIIRPKMFVVSVHCYDKYCMKILALHAKWQQFLQSVKRRKDPSKKVLSEPKERLTPEQEAKLQIMRADISVASGWREPLYAILGLEYTGKKKNSMPLLASTTIPPPSRDAHTYEPLIMDAQTGMRLPRSLILSSLPNKLQFLKENRKDILGKNQVLSTSTKSFSGPILLSPQLPNGIVFKAPKHTRHQKRIAYERACVASSTLPVEQKY